MPLSIRALLEQGFVTSKEIQTETDFSQPAVSRQLRSIGDSVITILRGRSPIYTLTRNAFGGDDKLPLYMVDAYGNNIAVAVIRPLAHGGFFVDLLTDAPLVLAGERGNGLYDDIPFFLSDLAPQGFLGRQIAAQIATQSDDFPSDPRHWNSNHIGRYLISNGDDLPGNFKFGSFAHLRVRYKPVINTAQDYPALADSVMNGIVPGSSVGGEQPKFTTFCSDISAHVIVKFSPKGNDSIAQRWRDILITEFHATEVIHSKNFPAAETRLLEIEGRLFLESRRFDRTGEYGRMPMISLQSVDAEFIGLGSNWPQIMGALLKKDLISWQHVFDAECLWTFGHFINNTDMHLGNLSLAIDGSVFRLLPVYDMCSMGFAPQNGEVSPYRFMPPELNSPNLEEDTLQDIKKMAHDFWRRVAGDERISDDFRAFLRRGNPVRL